MWVCADEEDDALGTGTVMADGMQCYDKKIYGIIYVGFGVS